MRSLAQTAAVTSLNLRNLRARLGSSAVAIAGIAGVVGVFVAVLSIEQGFRRTLEGSARRDRAIVLRAGANDEMSSGLSREQTRLIAEAPGVARTTEGPLASAELFVINNLPKRSTGTDANVPMRGVQPAAFRVKPEVRIVDGRNFVPGRNEIIAGRAAAAQFAGLELGNVLRWGRGEWTVVGLFEAGGTAADGEIWCDVSVLQPLYRRGDTFQVVYVALESEQAFDTFKDALTTDPRLEVKVLRESEFYAEQTEMVSSLIIGLGIPIALLMGIGAVFGAVNTMYTAVAARTREIATLRALGFRPGAVVASVLAEALLLAIAGGVIGGALAYLVFNGFQTSTINWKSFSQVSFAFAVTPALLAQGAAYAILMGLIGGLFPAIRAARMPVASALREL